ncbi:MAG: accessory gene regulator B family protein, partial [Lachnospiraceae bacterium]|nr:accessory gene regulator B family protein [Lachnospiraceae bacterium]
MIKELAKRIVDYQITKKYLDITERSKYVYAYEITINQLINLLISFILALILREVYSIMLFLVLYIPIRKYSGGFHASSNEKCILYSSIVIWGIILITKILLVCDYDRNLGFTINGMLMLYVNIVAPIETNNKKLDIKERRRYKKYIHFITFIHLILIMINIIMFQSKILSIEL